MRKVIIVALVLLTILAFSGCSSEKSENKRGSELELVATKYTEAIYACDHSTYLDLLPDFCRRNVAKSFGLSEDATKEQMLEAMEKLEDSDQTIEILSVSVLSQEEVNDFSGYSEFNEIFNGTVTIDDYKQIKEIAKVRVDLKMIISEEERLITGETTCVKIDNRWFVAYAEVTSN